ncbi:MAG TPA: sigma-70 family RNA polymerase sigma factor [Firmicutes bacterium]|nr:sigma-70 family RNA polymerase sigma factor [Bacillota bacterium]
MTETQLIKRAQNGDEDAFRELVETHQSKVYHLLLGMLRSPEVAGDLTQETFIKAWKSLSRFRLDSTFWTWLYRIAYRSALDYIKLKKLDLTYLAEEELNLQAEEKAEPLAAVLAKDRTQELFSALQELSFNNRVAIVLYYFQGLSYKEIAAVTKRRLGSIRTDLHRGKTKLRQILCRRWGLPDETEGEDQIDHSEPGCL